MQRVCRNRKLLPASHGLTPFKGFLCNILPCCHSASPWWRLSSPSSSVLFFLLSVSLAVASIRAVPVVLPEAPLLSLPGCYAFPMLYYIKITQFFSHLHPVKLLHNEHSSSSADLLNPPKKPATNPLPCWLLRWCFVSSAQAPSHRKHCTIFCFSYPHTLKISIFSCKALPKAAPACFCVLTFLNILELETEPDSLGVFFSVYSIYQPRNTKKSCIPRHKKRF